MAKTRWTGRGALVAVQSTSAGTPWMNVGLSRNIAPPAMERNAIDVTGMEDTYAVVASGIEIPSQFTFSSLHASTDTVDALLDTVYGSHMQRNWRVRLYNGTYYWDTTFTGKVLALRAQAFSGSDPVVREVTVLRNSTLTYSVTDA